MGLTNTILKLTGRSLLEIIRHRADIHIIRSGDGKYGLRFNNGSFIGEIEKLIDDYKILFFDNYKNRMRFSSQINDNIDNVKTISQGVKSGKIRNIKDFEPPKYYTTPKILKNRGNTRIFQPIDLSKENIGK